MKNQEEAKPICDWCVGHGLVGNTPDSDTCPFCNGTGLEAEAKPEMVADDLERFERWYAQDDTSNAEEICSSDFESIDKLNAAWATATKAEYLKCWQAAKTEAAEQNAWHQAAIELCMITEAASPSDDPKATINALIDYYVGIEREQTQAQVERAVRHAVAHCSGVVADIGIEDFQSDEVSVSAIMRELVERQSIALDIDTDAGTKAWAGTPDNWVDELRGNDVQDQPDTDGWTKWHGAVNGPVKLGTTVMVKDRKGRIETGLVGNFCWNHYGHGSNEEIVAYKIVQPSQSAGQPVAQQGLTDEQILRLGASHLHVTDILKTITGNKDGLINFARALLSTQQPVAITDNSVLKFRAIHAAAIDGAIAYGSMGINPPPSEDHWLMPFYRIGQRLSTQQPQAAEPTFQNQVNDWMMVCFGPEISGDAVERNHRFIEESLELVQACGCTASEAHQLVDYVFGRPIGERTQEVGGVMVTLAALCLAQNIDMDKCGEIELARIWTKVDQIRAKQAAKPKHSPLPQASGEPT